MSEKYNDIYRIESSRLQNWNYQWQGEYFITICTDQRFSFFGDIEDGTMILSEIGKIAESEWTRTPDIRPDMNIELDAFCIMPNHFHGIIIIGKNEYNRRRNRRDAMHRVSTVTHRVSTLAAGTKNRFSPQRKNLASIIRGYKSAVTMYARKNNIVFKWQARFYDHIMRDDASRQRIRQYIENNAANWDSVEFFTSRVP